MTRRDEIVAALSTVAGVSASPVRPDSVMAGSSWPVWRQTVWRNQVPDGVREEAWYVYVALSSATLESTAGEGDPLVELVGDALIAADLSVAFVEPTLITVDPGGQTVPVLRFSLTRS